MQNDAIHNDAIHNNAILKDGKQYTMNDNCDLLLKKKGKG